jgi:iron complex transport system ATP-binding protein
MALAQDTETIFLDEPTTYLDVRHQLEVMEVAKKLSSQGKAVVLVLHDLCLALRTGDRIAVFSEGQLRRLGTPQEVYDSGILTEVFGTEVGRVETEHGTRYYYV